MASVALSPTYLTPDFTPTNLLAGGVAVAEGDTVTFSNSGTSFLVITAAASIDVTVSPGFGVMPLGKAVDWPTITVPEGTTALGPFHSALATAGEISLVFATAATNVLLIQMPGVY